MKDLLNAASVNKDGFIMGEPRTDSIYVHIMTIEELCNFLRCNDISYRNTSYNFPAYYVYGIAGLDGANSTIANIKAVGVDWFRQLNVSTALKTFSVGGQEVFGGPLYCVDSDGSGFYDLNWYVDKKHVISSKPNAYWSYSVPGSTYVVVVHI